MQGYSEPTKHVNIIRNISRGGSDVHKMINLSVLVDINQLIHENNKNPNYVIKFPSDNDYKND